MGSSEHAVDVSCRGLRLGVSLTLAEVGPTTGFIEIGQPLPVGSEVMLAAGPLEIHGRVMRVREAVEGRAAGMIVSVSGLEGEAKQWWDGQVTGEDPIALTELEAPPAPEGGPIAASEAEVESESESESETETAAASEAASEPEPATASEPEVAAETEAAPATENQTQTEFEAADTEVDTGDPRAADGDAASDGVPASDDPGGSKTAMMDANAIAAIEAEATGSDAELAEREAEAAAAGVESSGGDAASSGGDGDGAGEGERSGTNSEGEGRKKKGRRRRRKKR